MPAIHFDITGDNSNMVSVIQDTTERVKRMAETMDNLRGADPFKGIEDASKELNVAIKDNERNITQLRGRLQELMKQQAEAAAKGDMAGVARLSSEMESVAQVIQTTSQQTDRYKESLAALGQDADKVSGIMVKLLGGQEKYNAIISQLPGPLKNAVTGLNGMVGAAKAFIATPLGAVLAALVLAYKAVTTWLNKSAEGQQALAKISGYVSGVLAGLQQVVMDVGKALYNAFTNPKQAISELWQSLKNDLLGRIKAAGGVFVNFGKIIGNAFKGDFKEAGEAAKEMANDWQKVFTGKDVSEIKEGAKAVADRVRGIHDIGKAQSELSARENKLHRDRTAWMNEEAELDRQIAEERNKLRMGTQSERAAASARMQELINKKTARNVELAREEYEIKKASNALTDSSQEDLDEEERLRARVVQLETQGVTQKGFALRIQDSMNRSLGQTTERLKEIARSYKELMTSMGDDSERLEREGQALLLEAQAEGFEKQRAQSKLEHQNRLAEIEKRHRDRMKAIEKMQKEEYKLSHGGSVSGFVFDESDEAVTKANSLRGQEESNERQRYKNEGNAILKEYQTFSDKYLQMAKDFADKRRMLIKKGASEGEFAMFDKEVQEAMAGIGKSWAESGIDDGLKKWFDELGQQSLADLEIMLSDLELDFYLMGDNIPDDEVAKLSAQITLLKKAIKDGKFADETSEIAENAQNALVSWTELNKVLTDTAALFKEAGDAIGGDFGEALKMVGNFSTSVAKINNAAEAFKNAKDARNTVAMITSGVTIAGAAVSIASEVAGKIKEARERTKEVDNATRAYYRTLRQIQDSKALESLSNAFGTDTYTQFIKNTQFAKEAGEAIGNISKSLSGETVTIKNWGKALVQSALGPMGTLFGVGSAASKGKTIAGDIISDMRTGWQKFWGSGKNIITASMSDFFDSNGNLLGDKLQEWYSTYGKGLSDANKKVVEDMLSEFDRLTTAKSSINSFLGDMFGNIASDLASEMVDNFFEAGDAITDMTEHMDEFAKSVAKSIVQGKLMGEIFTDDNQTIIADMIAAGKTSEAVTTFNGLLDQVKDLAPGLNDFLSGIGLSATGGSSNVEASSKGFAAMSQETGSELNGRFTAIQISNETIAQGMATVVTTLLSMQAMMTGDGSALSDIRDIHMIEATYLADIAKQTKPLPAMAEAIDKIQRSTANL